MFNIIVSLLRKMDRNRQMRIDEFGEDAELIKMLKVEHKKDWEHAYFKIKKII